MPELPEVETIKRQLGNVLAGKQITQIEVRGTKSFEGDQQLLIGAYVIGTRRRGKGLIIDLEKIEREIKLNVSLVVHLKMTGQMIYEPHGKGDLEHLKHRVVGGHPTADFIQKLPSNHTRVILKFIDSEGNAAGVLFFNDQRKFGWMKLMNTDEVEKLAFISRLGPEPWQMTDEQWKRVLKTNKPIKVRLMEQEVIAGVGNIYANDALWEAGIDPRRKSSSLTESESKLLKKMVVKVLEEGVFYGGATAMDGKYVDLEGVGGKYQEHFRAYQRINEKCLRKNCSGIISKIVLGGRGTFYCPECQK